MHYAVYTNNVREVARIYGRDKEYLEMRDESGKTPMHLAASLGEPFMVKFLYHLGATDLEVRDNAGHTPLMCAVKAGMQRTTKKLIKLGACVNVTTCERHWTPLHYAAWYSDVRLTRLLLEHTTTRNSRTKCGATPFDIAARCGKYDVARIHSVHCDVDNVDNQGFTNIGYAATNDRPCLVDFMVEMGTTQLHAVDERGRTLAHITAERHAVRSLARVLHHGCRVDAQDDDGKTPMHRAIDYYYQDRIWLVMDVLLEYGSRALWIEDNEGRRPIDCARSLKVAEQLRQLYFSRSLLSTLLFIDREIATLE